MIKVKINKTSRELEKVLKTKDKWYRLAQGYKKALIIAKQDRALFAKRLTELQNELTFFATIKRWASYIKQKIKHERKST